MIYDSHFLLSEISEIPKNWNEEDLSTLKDSFAHRENIKSLVAVPLKLGNEPVGIIFVNYRTTQHFTEKQRRLITLFSDQAALAIKYIRMMGTKDKGEVNNNQEYQSCFISHSSKDETFVQKLYKDLIAMNVHCWYAPADLKIGDRTRAKIDEVVNQYDRLLLVLSESSINSQWVEQEVETALEKERKKKLTTLFPIRLDGKVMKAKKGWAKFIQNTRNIGDFSNWSQEEAYQESLNRLLRDLEKKS